MNNFSLRNISGSLEIYLSISKAENSSNFYGRPREISVLKRSKFYIVKLNSFEENLILKSKEKEDFRVLFFIGRARYFKGLGLSKKDTRNRLNIYRAKNIPYEQLFNAV